jgi:arabinofuranosyltransferase
MAKPRLVQLAVLALLAAVIGGALALSFLCDDAYITFRYVSNARDGLGLVWNPPPFQPVEGYTSFLWALVLWAAWSLTGLEPPAIW